MPMGYVLGFSDSFVRGDFIFTVKSPNKLEMVLRSAPVLLYVLSSICSSFEKSCPGLELLVLFQSVEPPGGFILNIWCPFVIGH